MQILKEMQSLVVKENRINFLYIDADKSEHFCIETFFSNEGNGHNATDKKFVNEFD